MKTPDESKCGMECIRTNAERICVKPENGQRPRCEQLVEESLSRIRQFESTYRQLSKALCGKENATLEELLRTISQLKNTLEVARTERDAVNKDRIDLMTRLAQAERERDAAVKDMTALARFNDGLVCEYCGTNTHYECSKCVYQNEGFKWRGVCEENSKEDKNG